MAFAKNLQPLFDVFPQGVNPRLSRYPSQWYLNWKMNGIRVRVQRERMRKKMEHKQNQKSSSRCQPTDNLRGDVEKLLTEHPPSSPPESEWAAVYVRISRLDKHSHSYSMEIQPDRSEEYARSKGRRIHDVYTDPDRTGRHSRRDGLQRLIRDMQAGKFKIIVIHRLDRLYRNLESLLGFIRLIQRHNVRLISVTEHIDTESPWGRLVLYVLGALAEMYVRYTSERTRESKMARAQAGLPNGNLSHGYCRGNCSTCLDPNGKGYCPRFGQADWTHERIPCQHPIDSHAVRLIVSLSADGWSDLEIADYLNRHDFVLPDGTQIHFRTRGIRGRFPPGPFSRDTIRDILKNPFPAGMVARYPRPPLDMEDDVEHPKRKRSSKLQGNARTPIELIRGKHEAIYPFTLWQESQQRRQRRGTTPISKNKPKQQSLFYGSGRCWVCYEHDRRLSNLQGVKNSQGRDGLRCALLHKYSQQQRLERSNSNLEQIGELESVPNSLLDEELITKHKSFIPLEPAQQAIFNMVKQFVIPAEWLDQIVAYTLNDDGLIEFEREQHNLRQALGNTQTMFEKGIITRAQFDQKSDGLARKLAQASPLRHMDSAAILPLINDFGRLWGQLERVEQSALIRIMFTDVFIDQEAQIRKIRVNSPFDQLLKIPENL